LILINLFTTPLQANLDPLIANMNSKFSNFIMCGKLKKFSIFPREWARMSIHLDLYTTITILPTMSLLILLSMNFSFSQQILLFPCIFPFKTPNFIYLWVIPQVSCHIMCSIFGVNMSWLSFYDDIVDGIILSKVILQEELYHLHCCENYMRVFNWIEILNARDELVLDFWIVCTMFEKGLCKHYFRMLCLEVL